MKYFHLLSILLLLGFLTACGGEEISTANLPLSEETTQTTGDTEPVPPPTPVTYGWETPFTGELLYATNVLLAYQVSVPADMSFNAAEVIVKSVVTPASGRMALYNDAGTKPSTLISGSDLKSLAVGVNSFSFTPVDVIAGNYWIVFNFNNSSTLGVQSNTGSTTARAYRNVDPTTPWPTDESAQTYTSGGAAEPNMVISGYLK